jgi:hypothetical protein
MAGRNSHAAIAPSIKRSKQEISRAINLPSLTLGTILPFLRKKIHPNVFSKRVKYDIPPLVAEF